MPETSVQNEAAAPVAAETAARTEPARESSSAVYTEFELSIMRERGELREALRKAEAEKNQMFGRALVAERHLADAKAVIRDLRAQALVDHERARSRAACQDVVDLGVVAREQTEGWAREEPGTMRDLTEVVRCYSHADSLDAARERLTAYLVETYADTEPDEESGRVMLTQFTGGVLSMLEDTVVALGKMLDYHKSITPILWSAFRDDRIEANTAAFGDAYAPVDYSDGPGWLESLTWAVRHSLPGELEALYAVADEAGDRIAKARRRAQDEYETACAAYADAKRVS